MHAREQLEPHLKDLYYLVYGGERHTVLAFRGQCQFLRQLEGRTLDLLLDTRHPRQAAPEGAAERVWSSVVVQW